MMKMAAAAGVVVLLLVGAAEAATPNPAAMTLQAADLPGAHVVSQGSAKVSGFSAAYQRSFQYKTPPSSGVVFIQSEALLASDAATATTQFKLVKRVFSTSVGRKLIVAEVARQLKLKPKAVLVKAVRTIRAGDQGFELPVTIRTGVIPIYVSLAYIRLDRVVEMLVSAGIRPITAAGTTKLGVLVVGHIGAQFTPVSVTPPTVTGTAQQGQTLTATPGTWNVTDATVAYQWQHCDATGANCADIAGATTTTYVVQPTDVGGTLKVNETATNRFGTAVGTSAVTAVVT